MLVSCIPAGRQLRRRRKPRRRLHFKGRGSLLTELLFWYTPGVYCNKPSNVKTFFFDASLLYCSARLVSATIIRSFYFASAQAMNVPSFLSGFWLSFICLSDFHVLPTFKPSPTINNHQQSSNSCRYHIVSSFHSLLHIKTFLQNSYKFIRSGSSH
jgi:hypothetical protein